jgi:Predicted extracellular nuclease
MPPAGSLSQSEIDLIAQWIDEGALEVPAVDSENLFFSEYIEGSSNNKVLEIYNPTGSAVDLSEYKVQQSNNGAGWGMDDGPPPAVEPGFTLQLSGTLANGEVYILSADAASGVFLAQADESLSYPSVCHYNGDDAVGLFHNDVLIDVIGIPTEEGAWNVAGVSGATGEHTLIRKSTVTTGNTDWAVSAGTSSNDSEWIVEEQDYSANLGFHVYGTGGENLDPIANAGSNQTVIYGSSVTMSGSASADPDGTIESYIRVRPLVQQLI